MRRGYKGSHGVKKAYRRCQRVTEGYKEYKILQRCTVGYRGLHEGYKGFHGGYDGLQGLKRFTGKYEGLLRVLKGC